MITVILTLIFKREFSQKLPLIVRFINRFVLDRLQHIKVHRQDVFTLYCGRQGTGKTYSLVKHCCYLVHNCKYKHVISNMPIAMDDCNIELCSTVDDFVYLAKNVTDCVFVIDELQNFVDSFKTPDDFYYIFCTLRKRNCILLATSQLFDRVSVKLREQVNRVVFCKTYFGCLTLNKIFTELELNNDKKIKMDNPVAVILSEKKLDVQSEKIREIYNTYSF